VAANAASNALATVRACPAAPVAWLAAALSHPAYGAAAAGPRHACWVRPDVTDENDDAADPNSEANASHAAAASNIGPEPAPEKIRAELISGGNTEKFMTPVPSVRAATIVPAQSAPTTRSVYDYTK
jgi:hypothetical protein